MSVSFPSPYGFPTYLITLISEFRYMVVQKQILMSQQSPEMLSRQQSALPLMVLPLTIAYKNVFRYMVESKQLLKSQQNPELL